MSQVVFELNIMTMKVSWFMDNPDSNLCKGIFFFNHGLPRLLKFFTFRRIGGPLVGYALNSVNRYVIWHRSAH